jgi:hypothetical protein
MRKLLAIGVHAQGLIQRSRTGHGLRQTAKTPHNRKNRIPLDLIVFRDRAPKAKALVQDQVMSADARKQISAKFAADDTPVL